MVRTPGRVLRPGVLVLRIHTGMKVFMRQTFATPTKCYLLGRKYEFPDDEARRLVAAGLAYEAVTVTVTTDKPAKPTKNALRPTN